MKYSYKKKKKILLRQKSLKTGKKNERVNGELLYKKEGWITLHIYGNPYQRGFAHGFLLNKEMEETMKVFKYLVKNDFKISFEKYLDICNEKIKPVIMNKFPEFYEEIHGMVDGFKSKGLRITIEQIIGWNSVLSMYDYFVGDVESTKEPRIKRLNRCSAFIATGNATQKGDIVMAHNTHSEFITGNLLNIVLYVTPDTGFPFVMQTSPGLIASSSDWFICSTGMIGCETTISSISYKSEFGSPYFCRIRQAIQYGESIDDYINIMLKDNAGDYACSWQFGNIKTNEIALFELGLKEHSIKRTFNGVYYGMNSAIDPTIYIKETNDNDKFDVHTTSGSRNFRLNYLLNKKYYGKINVENAKKILSDHYDISVHKEIMNSRTICKHTELHDEVTNRKPFFPYGCTDGKVVNSTMATNLKFLGRFGSSCGRIFKASEFLKKHPEYNNLKGILKDFPKYDWVNISYD